MRRSFLLFFLFGFCGGIGLAEFWAAPIFLTGLGTLVALVGSHWRTIRFPAIIMLGVCAGLWRWTVITTPATNSLVNLVGRQSTVVGDMTDLPVNAKEQTVVLRAIHQGQQALSGKLQVYLPPFPHYQVGQRLTVECQPELFPTTSRWRQWSHGVMARCFNAVVKQASVSPPSFRLTLARIENAMVAYIHRSFNEPQASLLAGIILGSQSGMPAELTRDFQATGTTHIVALSGFNVTIIVSSVLVVLVRLIGRRWAWIPGLVLVIVFVMMSGASASVVRAAIMAIVSQLAMFFGRPIHPGRLLSYTAIGMLWANPLILLHDLGFQLSFLATVGLMFMSQPLAQHLPFIPETLGLRENLATTISAIVATEPLLLWQFGRISLIAPVVNIIVLPFIPLAMGLGTLCLVGLWSPQLSGPVVALTDAVLRLVLLAITTSAHWRWSLVYLPAVATLMGGMVFVFLAVIIVRHGHAPETHPA